ncbi:MAG: UDP-N-acetylmuramoyl-L-alanyl-D-glutamate--2,6-diaminopimelate ligase [Opitutales bacterium]|nr:UDP-N-acetylmuramoyl-L-alanyl-D-glutamate--2,6-diaminopimelate ligase [Opitutales bacterium]
MIGLGYANVAGFLSYGFEPRRSFSCPREGGGGSPVVKKKPKISSVLGDLPVLKRHGLSDGTVTDLCLDSRRVTPGAIFFALPGIRTDGCFYIEEAIDRGAVAIVAETPQRPNPKVAFFQVEDARLAMAQVARKFFQRPDEDVAVHSITGTNGKTTVSYLARFLLQETGIRTGMVGTIEYDLGERTVPSFRTTPEAIELYGMMAQMKASGCTDVVVESSSHGIDQKRMFGLHSRTATFLNLTQDHLDYHGSLEEYFQVKCRLFNGDNGQVPETVILNLDDPKGKVLQDIVEGKSRLITFGEDPEAMIRAEEVEMSPEGSTMKIIWPEGSAKVRSPLVGRYNVSNVLAAISIAYARGREMLHVLPQVARFPGVPGRMEKIVAGQDFPVLVDYAHTDDALRNALQMLRGVTKGNLYVVFGCGGDRDRSKRPAMTRAALDYADHVWATADNPRKEDLGQIFSDMAQAVSGEDPISFVEDRRRAISLALDKAGEGDCVLIAGKGHESFQEYGDTVLPFDDRLVAAELLQIKRVRHDSGETT